VYLYVDLFELLDVGEFESDFSPAGEAVIHPTLMLRSIFYGLTHGVVSGHKLAAMCKFDARFMILCGEQSPDRRTFDRFLARHAPRIEALFAKVVQLAQKMGLVSLGRVAIDGSQIKANTSKNRQCRGRSKGAEKFPQFGCPSGIKREKRVSVCL
jgi:transposase